MNDHDPKAIDAALISDVFQQNWENVRSIKSERIWFMNTYAAISAGTLTLLPSAHDEPLIEVTLILSLCLLALIGLISSLRLKAELEECLEKIQMMVTRANLEELTALVRPAGQVLRYPAFRWVFPIFYSFTIALNVAVLVYRLTVGGYLG